MRRLLAYGSITLAGCGAVPPPASVAAPAVELPVDPEPVATHAATAPDAPPPAPAPTMTAQPRTYQGWVTVRATDVHGVDEGRVLSQGFGVEHDLRSCYEADMTTAGMYASEIAFRLVFQWDGALLGADRDPASPVAAGPMADCMSRALGRMVVPPKGALGRAVLVVTLNPR